MRLQRLQNRKNTVVNKLYTVIKALFFREIITRYGRHGIGMAWVIFEPIIFIGPVLVFWLLINHHFDKRIPLVEFLLTGYPPFVLWRNCASRSIMGISANGGLLYHRQVAVIAIVLARAFLEIVGGIGSMVIIYSFLIPLEIVSFPADFLLYLCGWFYMAAFGAVSAILFCAMSEVSETFEKILHPVLYLMMPISGAFFMVSWLPSSVSDYALLNPITNGFEMIRDGYFGDRVQAHYNVGYALSSVITIACIGLLFLNRVRRNIRIE